MKAKLILINWICSFVGLTVVSPFWAVMVGKCWFIVSALLVVWAQKKTWFDRELEMNKFFKFLMEE